MKTKFSLLFYLKKRNNYQSGNAPVYLRITVQGERSEVGISRNIDPVNWDIRKERARGNKDEAIELNRHVESISTKLKGIQSRLEKEEIPYTAEELKDEFLGKGSSAKLLLEVLRWALASIFPSLICGLQKPRPHCQSSFCSGFYGKIFGCCLLFPPFCKRMDAF